MVSHEINKRGREKGSLNLQFNFTLAPFLSSIFVHFFWNIVVVIRARLFRLPTWLLPISFSCASALFLPVGSDSQGSNVCGHCVCVHIYLCVCACVRASTQDSEPGQLRPSVGAWELHLFTVS